MLTAIDLRLSAVIRVIRGLSNVPDALCIIRASFATGKAGSFRQKLGDRLSTPFINTTTYAPRVSSSRFPDGNCFSRH